MKGSPLFGADNVKERLYEAIEVAMENAQDHGMQCAIDEDAMDLIVSEVLDVLKEEDLDSDGDDFPDDAPTS